MPAYATPTSGRAWWTAMVNKTGASTPQIIPQAFTTAATQAPSPWYANLGVFAPQEGINVQSVLAPEGGINVQSLGAPQVQAPGYNETQWTGPQPQVDASFRLPQAQQFSTTDDFAPTITVASQAPVASAAPSNFQGDDYEALFAIAMMRPDIFEGIGKDTGWNQNGAGGNNIEAGTNWGGNDVGSKAWYWTTPAMRMRVVEEWIRQGMKTGEGIIKNNNGDPQAIARALGAPDVANWSAGWKKAVSEAKALDWLSQKWSGGFDPTNGWLGHMRSVLDPLFSNDEAKKEGRIYLTGWTPGTVENLRVAALANLGGRDLLQVAQAEGWNGQDLADFTAGGKYGSLYRDKDPGYSDSYTGAYTLLPWLSAATTDLTNTWMRDHYGEWQQYDPTRTALYRKAISTTPPATGAVPATGTPLPATGAPVVTPWNPYTGVGTRTTPKQYSFETQIGGKDGRPGLLTGRLDEELWRYLNTGETKTADQDATALRDIITDAAAKGDRPEYTKPGAMWTVQGANGKYTIYFYGPNKFVIWKIK